MEPYRNYETGAVVRIHRTRFPFRARAFEFTASGSNRMRFTDYYAEASCTAGRANFITGELPIRTGLTTVGQAGAEIGRAHV